MSPATAERLAALDPEARALVLDLLDEMSEPLDRRTIEKALGRAGITRRQRMQIVPALLQLDLIALLPRE